MPDDNLFTLRQVDQTCVDFAAIADDLEFIKSQLTRLICRDRAHLPTRQDREDSALQPDGTYYRELATKLRRGARDCRLPNPQRDLLTLARRYERRATYFDRRARRAPSR